MLMSMSSEEYHLVLSHRHLGQARSLGWQNPVNLTNPGRARDPILDSVHQLGESPIEVECILSTRNLQRTANAEKKFMTPKRQ